MSGSLNSLLPDPLSPLQPAAAPLVKAPDSYDTADAYVSTKNALTDWVSDQRAQSSAMGLWDDQTGLPTAAGVKNALLSIALGTNSSGGGVAARSAGGRQGELALEAPVVAPVAAPAAVAEAAPVAAAPSVPVEAVPAAAPIAPVDTNALHDAIRMAQPGLHDSFRQVIVDDALSAVDAAGSVGAVRAGMPAPVGYEPAWKAVLDHLEFGPSAPAAAAAAPVPEPVPGIRAYHGSPAAFDRFSNDYIGTGEGAQAYGVGHYAAENEGIARSYRDALSRRSMSDPEDRAAYAAASDKGIAAIRGIANLQGRMTQESMAAPAYRPRIEADGTPVVNTDIHPEVAAKYQPQMDALVAARDAAKADADAVAIKYNPAVGGQLYDSDNPIHRTAYYLDRNGGDVGRTLLAIDDELAMVDRNRQGWDNTKPYDDAAGRLNEMKQILQTDPGSVPPYKTPGHMYELNLRVDPERMLAWDKPRDQLAPAVREFAEANYPDAWAKAADGGSLYERMAREADQVASAHRTAQSDAWSYLAASENDPDKALAWIDESIAKLQRTGEAYAQKGLSIEGTQYGQALQRLRTTRTFLEDPELLSEEPLSGEALVSRQLHEAGVPGIRYLDASSRSGRNETHNHVIFDPENIEIVRRYGLAGLLAGGGAAAASGAGGQQ